jgi:SAM-dependent methyltransferase
MHTDKDCFVLNKENDPMGLAIFEHLQGENNQTIIVSSPEFDDDEIPVDYLFRSFKDFPANEQNAVSLAKGKTLDIGAGAGVHAIYLKEIKGLDLEAIDISPYTAEYLNGKGIKTYHQNIFAFEPSEKYDTILLLMNGLGIAETNEKLPQFLSKLTSLLNPKGQILIESCGLDYLFESEEEAKEHSGEIIYKMEYKGIECPYFSWLYFSFDKLESFCYKQNLKIQKVHQQKNGSFLARITLQ